MSKAPDKVRRCGLALLVCLLVLTGTYIRVRPENDVPDVDWLVAARLVASVGAAGVGVILLSKRPVMGIGGGLVGGYVGAAALSAVNSQYPLLVSGYSVLLVGVSLLMLGLVYGADSVEDLEQLERIWCFTMVALVLKDGVTSLLIPETMVSADGIGRLGMGVTHPNELSQFAVLALCLSFAVPRVAPAPVLFCGRLWLLFVVVNGRSRMSLLACAAGAAALWISSGVHRLGRLLTVVTVVSILGTAVSLYWLVAPAPFTTVIDYLRRGQDTAGLASFSGRTLIWERVMTKALESPIVGHGYGVTRLTMGGLPGEDWEPSHAHNEFVEASYSMGLVGVTALVAMLGYSLLWFRHPERLRKRFGPNVPVHAVCVLVVFATSACFECRITNRLSPVHPLLFGYVMMLDKKGTLAVGDD
jgi:hypothetical protein